MLGKSQAFSGIAVKDMEQARQFYVGVLRLETIEEYDLMWLQHGDGRRTLIYEQPASKPASYTVLNFPVDDIDSAVDALLEAGVSLERFDGLAQDERGVFREGGPYIAWFRDPSGNVLSVLQER